ncbi:MAG: NAD(P)/FAD-dependent oxidoreductase [Bacteroidia bacterium]|nr:NAD(P)/FAD-dependent oxidoreductase [Bacteroidia bacterium]
MHIVIIGNGISGVTCARHIRKLSDHQITIISSETEYFFSRTALMYIYMGHMRFKDTQPYEPWFWEKNRIDLKRDHVIDVDTSSKTLKLKSGKNLDYDKLVLALGSASNKFGWPGQDLKGVGGLYSFQDLEQMETFSPGLKRAVIVGGGLIGIEMAEMFHSRHIPVTFLVREKSYWDMVLPSEESEMINHTIVHHGIDLRLETELKEIVDDGKGAACAVVTNKGERIECGYVGLTAGVHPNIGFVKDNASIETQKGILVNEFLQTSADDVYAIGDCAQMRNPEEGRRPVEAVWYTGRMTGETAAYNICGQSVSYDPGIWFNSAKFLDIEYQTYGTVLAKPPDHHKSLVWQHPKEDILVRIVYDDNDKSAIGFNLFGIRFRHEVCEKWIKDKTPIDDVLEHLSLANFDPEFYPSYEHEIITQYNQQNGKQLSNKSKRSWDAVFSFLNT